MLEATNVLLTLSWRCSQTSSPAPTEGEWQTGATAVFSNNSNTVRSFVPLVYCPPYSTTVQSTSMLVHHQCLNSSRSGGQLSLDDSDLDQLARQHMYLYVTHCMLRVWYYIMPTFNNFNLTVTLCPKALIVHLRWRISDLWTMNSQRSEL